MPALNFHEEESKIRRAKVQEIRRSNRQRPPSETHLAIMSEILRRLPDRDRQALALYFDGHTEYQISESLGMGIGYFRQLKHDVQSHFTAAIARPVRGPGAFGDLVHAVSTKGASA